MEFFRTAQLYFKSLITSFDIFVISEHCLFEEQLDLLNQASVLDNHPLLSGNNAHGGVALLWKWALNDYIIPLTSINSDRILGIQCNLTDSNPLCISGIYLPSSSHNTDEFCEYFDYLWALYGPLSVKRYVILMGDLNGDLGNSLADKSTREPNQHGLKLLELANDFNLCPINLTRLGDGPTDSYLSLLPLITYLCPTVRSIAYILPKRLK